MTAMTKVPKQYLKIKDKNDEDRPREKLITKGQHILTKAELLGLIIGSGTEKRTSVDVAAEILNTYNNNLTFIAKLSIEELKNFNGIGDAKAALIVSAMELANRLQNDSQAKLLLVKTARNAYTLMQPVLTNKLVEEFWVILLNSQSRVIKVHQVSKGGLSKASVDPRLVFKQCFLYNAVGLILVHNHPSGNTTPSPSDVDITKRLSSAAKVLDLKILDHIIFTDEDYFSFADEGLLC